MDNLAALNTLNVGRRGSKSIGYGDRGRGRAAEGRREGRMTVGRNIEWPKATRG